MSKSSLLELTHQRLYWPPPHQIWQPSGAGPMVYARLADEKIGNKIRRELEEAKGARVGILAANPLGDATESPLAVVCEFFRPISDNTLKEIYRLAWSFSRTRALVTVEPQLLRVWSCCEPPEPSKVPSPIEEINQASLSEQAANALQWVELVSGEFFEKHNDRFQRSGAADQKLLENLKEVRKQLIDEGLDSGTIHDLLARLIFTQYLFQKKDVDGNPALNREIIQDLVNTNILSKAYDNLPDILENFEDTYQLFRWLNHKFNGDLFPGKGNTEEEREQEWQAEMDKVREKNSYFKKLADFIRGDLELKTGQLCLWPMYSFDVIPLEFISSVYEEFVSKKEGQGVHYTPEFIVDFILDGVLPWDDEEWDLKILDPACGSGIFLVKAYQRLIYRWEKAHNKNITSDILKSLLENNFLGVDIDREAIRVASFSFYLMMLDNIDPRNYWENEVKFPTLRNKKLIAADFFAEDIEGFRTEEDSGTYDLVLGNAPWGKNSITKKAKEWTKKYNWNDCISYGNIAPFFLSKAVKLTKDNGYISMMQPAGTLIFNQGDKNQQLRFKLFSETKVSEIVDLSALRFGLFKNAISPTCIITLENIASNNDSVLYLCPKILYKNQSSYSLVIEPQNIHWVQYHEILQSNKVLIALTWGNRRDFQLIKRLSQGLSLNKLEQQEEVFTRQGITRGNRKKINNDILNKYILQEKKFPKDTFLYLDPKNLSINHDLRTHSRDSTDFTAFNYPQMILKQSWQTKQKRFQSAIGKKPINGNQGLLCSKSYVSIHAKAVQILESAWLSYNSILAVYYLLLSSGTFASYIPKVGVADLLKVPIPEPKENMLEGIETYEDVDQRIREFFEFKDSEWTLIEDLFNYTLPDFKGDTSSPSRQRTQRNDEPELTQYCDYFIRVIKASFGEDKDVCATIYQEPDNHYLPVRLVAIHLNHPIHEGIKIEIIDSENLLKRLNKLNEVFLNQPNSEQEGIYYQRVARVYDSVTWNDIKVPTVYFIKPDKVRYWTRSMGLRDADEVCADIRIAGQQINSTK
ncbi:HsdM family class I SAM-dependent methyltransferase [Crocosphaera chwakensis]|uniref:site-specific DNA-methyltransferase (adenine-specific) n=1 Tax=Crocosphaera chwakensis CCY0110 TaxID=391612 RepID=A3IT95_9CHRO|nr:N-6 DNA methylase [Crocosphaera chwakensis]EAZ90280.1 type I restriction-modification system, M subunit, putative [Crocosphaera chwakensis CCY0110]